MNRNLTTFVMLVAALALAACGGQKAPSEASTGSEELKGKAGVYYYVTVSRPVGGTISSGDGKIDCGTSGGVTKTLCGPARYEWTQTATLSAYPDPNPVTDPYFFQSWAGDCSGDVADRGCVLDTSFYGADKWVVAVFNPIGRLGHGTITSPSLHAPKYFAFLGNDVGAPRCTNCHGQDYAGQSIAPSCNACHAAAGWANWQQSCSFCHGLKNPITMSGYAFEDGTVHQEWAAPPDDVNGRLTGTNGAATGAHQAHVAPNEFRNPIACSECHEVPTTAIHTLNHSLDLPFGPLSKSQGAEPTWDAKTLTCGSNYCHGNFNFNGVLGKAASLTWGGSLTGCTTCHDMPPAGHAYSSSADPKSCSGCHGGTVNGDGTINVADGLHINGQKDGGGGGSCDSCHWFPNSLTKPATGAHLAHYGLTEAEGSTTFGDLEDLEAKFPVATPTEAPSKYAFGCGNCHPIDIGQHSMGSGSTVAKVVLYEAGAPADTLKAKNSPTASYDATAKTCSGVYCHSSGQAAWSGTIATNTVQYPIPSPRPPPVMVDVSYPTFATTPSWSDGGPLGCDGCHGNPPRYPSAGPGSPGGNNHLAVDSYMWVVGHFRGIGAVGHADMHGNAIDTETSITCQTCHFNTTDPSPSSAGTSGFYWLETSGNYDVAGTNPAQGVVSCVSCHNTAGSAPADMASSPPGAGKVLPLRHVNGARDVTFDNRTTVDQAISYLPASPNTPSKPYWRANEPTSDWTNKVWNGTTVSFSLETSTYDQTTKTCTVACHAPLRWGAPHTWSWSNCGNCHPSYAY